jgi:hypothetical protein
VILKKGETVYKGCYADLRDRKYLVDVLTKFREVGGKRTIEVPIPKMVAAADRLHMPVLVTLLLPRGTEINHWPSRLDAKGRASQARVVSIEDEKGGQHLKAYSSHDRNFFYAPGVVVKPVGGFDEALSRECARGIHFFRSKRAAWDWVGVYR